MTTRSSLSHRCLLPGHNHGILSPRVHNGAQSFTMNETNRSHQPIIQQNTPKSPPTHPTPRSPVIDTPIRPQPQDQTKAQPTPPSIWASSIQAIELILTSLAIYAIYITYGIYHEKITQSTYGIGTHAEKLSAVIFLTAFQCAVNSIWSLLLIAIGTCFPSSTNASNDSSSDDDDDIQNIKQQETKPTGFWSSFIGQVFDNVPKSQYCIVACSYSIAMLSSTAALRFLPYLIQALTKSSKLIPVMIGKICRGHRYSIREYVHILLITIGIALFIFDPHKHQKSQQLAAAAAAAAAEAGSTVVVDSSSEWIQNTLQSLFPLHPNACAHNSPTAAYIMTSYVLSWISTLTANPSLMGGLLIILSLTMDAITGPTQDAINHKYRPNISSMCFWINVIPAFGLFIISFIIGELFTALRFISIHRDIIPDLFVYCFLAAIGQTVIVYALLRFNSMTLTIITTTRKFFSIIASVLWFGHSLLPSQWVGVGLVFSGIIADSQLKFVRQRQHASLESFRKKEGRQLPHVIQDENQSDVVEKTPQQQQHHVLPPGDYQHITSNEAVAPPSMSEKDDDNDETTQTTPVQRRRSERHASVTRK